MHWVITPNTVDGRTSQRTEVCDGRSTGFCSQVALGGQGIKKHKHLLKEIKTF